MWPAPMSLRFVSLARELMLAENEHTVDSTLAAFRKAGVAMTENTVASLEHRFQKGQSGNPAGKPKGARHKTTLLAERLLLDDVEKIVNAVLTAARNGDMTAAKIILDRIAPVSRRQCKLGQYPKIAVSFIFVLCRAW